MLPNKAPLHPTVPNNVDKLSRAIPTLPPPEKSRISPAGEISTRSVLDFQHDRVPHSATIHISGVNGRNYTY